MKDESKAGSTFPVSDEVFKQVYDSPHALPGNFKWITPDEDVRKIEKILGMPEKTIGAPLWISADEKHCPKCHRELSWLDIVSSAVQHVHSKAMIAQVILGERKYVNTESPRAIANVQCANCGTKIDNIRSFKCHNWAYAKQALLDVLERMEIRNAERD